VINKIEDIGGIIDSFGTMSLKRDVKISDSMDSLKEIAIYGIHKSRGIYGGRGRFK
jgi:hypothetical protein